MYLKFIRKILKDPNALLALQGWWNVHKLGLLIKDMDEAGRQAVSWWRFCLVFSNKSNRLTYMLWSFGFFLY
jgi:hypothetical protein